MENRAKLRFPRTLFSPFASCKSHKLISDVIHHHGRHRHRQHRQPQEQLIPFSSTSLEPLLPSSSAQKPAAASPYPSMCKPRCPDTFNEMVRETCILSLDRQKIHPSNDAVRGGGWMRCPPASPVSPLKQGKKQKQREKEKRRKTKRRQRRKDYRFRSSYEDWFSSDDEREEDDDLYKTDSETDSDTMLSSSRSFLSLSSSKSFSINSDGDSFGSTRTQKPPSARRREARRRKKREKKGMGDLEEKVKGSFAVVKSSRDPYNDFRASMAEMIMEKKIYGARELEQLLQCFLSLNSPHHHKAIVEVFAEICDALFFNQLGL